MTERFIADASVIARSRVEAISRRLEIEQGHGRIWTCGVTDLELLFSTRNCREHTSERRRRRTLPRASIDDAVLDRAVEVQGLLAARAQHRAVPIPDLIVAAAAECAGLAVLHYDADFDRIAKVTGQPVEWIAPRGSLD